MYHFYDYYKETLTREELDALQVRRLHNIVGHVMNRNETMRKLFNDAGIEGPSHIKSLDDIRDLPLLCKDDFRKYYPLELCCVLKTELAEMHMSSGSTGTPIVMPYTIRDLQQWADCMARCYAMAGAKPGDTAQITPGFGLFNGGFGMYHGARARGMFVIPAGAGNTARQIRLAKSFGTRVLGAVVSYAIRIMEELDNESMKLDELKIGIFGAETMSTNMRKRIENGLNIEAFDIYGMTETGGVGTLGMDCPEHNGIHVWDDHYILEVLDNKQKPVPDGEVGELVVTSLTREALPVIRYRTGDLTKIISRDRCKCGRFHTRIAPVIGRADDMMIVKGVNFFPKQVENALMSIPGIGNNYQIILEENDGVLDCRINVEAEASVSGYMVEKVLKETLGFSPKGDVFPCGSLPRQEGMGVRVFKQEISKDK